MSRHLEGLEIVRQSQNQAQYEKNRLETGMCKPSIILGLSSNHRLHIPSCFPGDDMHRPALNQAGDLFLPLWRSKIKHDKNDDPALWPWVVLRNDVLWQEHGAH